MVVDDEPAVLKLIKGLIEQLGCEVLAIADSREAALRVNTDKFDGVLLDGNMPHLDGFALTQKLRSSLANSSVPIVMLTGDGDVETMRKAFKSGITFFLSKPVSLERLGALVKVMRGPILKEKGHDARLPLRATVTCELGAKRFEEESVDVSERGMLLEASGGAGVGEELNLEFAVPQVSQPLKTPVWVVRKEAPDRIALQFLNLEFRARLVIQDFIRGQVKG